MPEPPPPSRPPTPADRSPTCARPPSTPPSRPWPARPTSSRPSPGPGSSTPAAPGACSCSSPSTGWSPGAGAPPTTGCSPPGRRSSGATSGASRMPWPGSPRAALTSLTGHDPLDRGTEAARRRAGLRGHVPAHRHHARGGRGADAAPSTRSATRCSSSAGPTSGTSTCTSTTPARPSRPASRRAARSGSGSPTSPAQIAAREQPVPLAVVACAAGPGIGALLREAGAVVVDSGPGGAPRPGSCSRRWSRPGSTAVVLLPGDRDTLMAAEIAAQAAAGSGPRRARGARPHDRAVPRRPGRARPRPVGARQRRRDDRCRRGHPARRGVGRDQGGADLGRGLPARATCSGSSTATSPSSAPTSPWRPARCSTGSCRPAASS